MNVLHEGPSMTPWATPVKWEAIGSDFYQLKVHDLKESR